MQGGVFSHSSPTTPFRLRDGQIKKSESVTNGGTPLAEKGRVYLTDEFGGRLGDGLHDEFVSYLIESGKLE